MYHPSTFVGFRSMDVMVVRFRESPLKLLSKTCVRLQDSLFNDVERQVCGIPPSQVPVWKMEHENTAKMNSLLLETSYCNFRVMRASPRLLGSNVCMYVCMHGHHI